MTRYRVDSNVSVWVWAEDPDEAQAIARNALDNALESDGVTGVYSDPRFVAVSRTEEPE